jgi:hypothetical protein
MKYLILLILILLSVIFWTSCGLFDGIRDPCGPGFYISVINVQDAVEGQPIGSITVSSSGENGSIFFSLDSTNYQSSPIFQDLSSGNYTVYAKDELGCMREETVEIGLIPVVSFRDDVLPILQENCNISTCHCDESSLCFENYKLVSSRAEEIARRAADRNMPPSYSSKILSVYEIQTLANWANQGAPDN